MEAGGGEATRLAVARLEVQAEGLLSKGIAPSTSKVYSSVQRIYLEFCSRLNLTPLPASEATLILFATELAQTRAHSTIRNYLAGVRHLHVTQGHGNPLLGTLKLDLVLKGIHRIKPNQSQARLPVTPSIMAKIKGILDRSPDFESCMLWAACCIGFFGFMRCGEFMLPDATPFDASKHLTAADIAVDSHHDPTNSVCAHQKIKDGSVWRGHHDLLGKDVISNLPCHSHPQLSSHPSRPLFVTADSKPVTKQRFIRKIREVLAKAGIDASGYKGHSFRIGAATTAAACGLNEGMSKTLGRWASSAYQVH